VSPVKAEIISIGDELLTGQKVNTNATFICSELAGAGIAVERIVACADIEAAIAAQCSDSLGRADLVLVTGGLGPTRDDRTKKTVADLLGRNLVFHQETYDRSLDRYRVQGVKPSSSLRQNAMVIEGSTVIVNTMGLAPGMMIPSGSRFDDHLLVLMPGVPLEMQAMMKLTVLPAVTALSGSVIVHSHIMTTGTGETTIAGMITAIEDALPEGTTLAYLPHVAGVSLRVSSIGPDRQVVEQDNRQVVDAIVSAVGHYVYATRDISLEEVVGELLLMQGMRITTAESCTGGLVASRLTDVAGSSGYVDEAYVVYSNDAKMRLLGVDESSLVEHGAVSELVAAEMARGALERSGADIAVSTTGIAGPSGGSREKPVGTLCIGLAVKNLRSGLVRITTETFYSRSDRARNKFRFSEAALRMVWKELSSVEEEPD